MKSVCVLFVTLAFAVSIVEKAAALPTPRDGTSIKSEELPTNQELFEKNKVNEDSAAGIPGALSLPGRVWCQHAGEEPVEDEDCQRHCIPKRYSYGLCIKNTCSCI